MYFGVDIWLKASLAVQVGRDVSECLQQAMDKRGLDMRVAVLVSIFCTSSNHIA